MPGIYGAIAKKAIDVGKGALTTYSAGKAAQSGLTPVNTAAKLAVAKPAAKPPVKKAAPKPAAKKPAAKSLPVQQPPPLPAPDNTYDILGLKIHKTTGRILAGLAVFGIAARVGYSMR